MFDLCLSGRCCLNYCWKIVFKFSPREFPFLQSTASQNKSFGDRCSRVNSSIATVFHVSDFTSWWPGSSAGSGISALSHVSMMNYPSWLTFHENSLRFHNSFLFKSLRAGLQMFCDIFLCFCWFLENFILSTQCRSQKFSFPLHTMNTTSGTML